MLQARHPQNNNIRPKIRQQLQVLRDKGVIEFLGRGLYRKIFKTGTLSIHNFVPLRVREEQNAYE